MSPPGWMMFAALPAMVIVGALCARGSTAAATALPVALLITVAAAIRFNVTFVLLGALLPIYAVGSIPSTALVFARLGLIGAIILTDIAAVRLRFYRMPNWRWWAYGLALLVAATVHVSATGAYLATTFILIALLGSRIGSSPHLYRRLFAGYRIGVLLSSLAVLGSVAGIVVLSRVEQRLGHAGLSYRSTAFSYQAALALVLWYWNPGGRRSRFWSPIRVLEALVITAALVSCGGRGGLLGLLVAMVLLPLSAGRVKATLKFVAVGAVGMLFVSALGFSTLSIDRLLPQERDRRIAVVDQYGSGRRDIYAESVKLARQNIIGGSGFEAASLSAIGGTAPTSTRLRDETQTAHLLLLALLIAGGIPLALAALLVLGGAAWKAYRLVAGDLPPSSWWVGAGIVIYLVNSLLEVGGGLLGVESILLFSCLVTVVERWNESRSRRAEFRRPGAAPALDEPRTSLA